MNRSQRQAKSTTKPKTGFFATLSNLLHGQGTSASSSRRLPSTLAVLALAIAAFAITAAPALATTTTTPIVSDISYASAHVEGKITSTTSSPFLNITSYAFQYSTDESNWITASTSNPPSPIGGGPFTDKKVEADIEGLKGGTEYFVRLIAQNLVLADPPEAVSPAPNPSFTTLVADPPSVETTDNALEVEYTTASASGKVNRPTKSNDLACNFEYLTDEAFNNNPSGEKFSDATQAPCETDPPDTPGVISDPGPNPVTAKLNGLANATTYHLRLVVSNASAADAKEAASTFTTLTVDPPNIISTDDASEVFSLSANASGEIERPANPDPAFDITDCRFEYVTEDQFGANGFDSAGSAGCVESIDNAPEAKTHVTAALSGLEPATTYHLRLAAKNAAAAPGTKVAASTFTTAAKVAAPTILTIPDATDVKQITAEVTGEIQRPAGDDPALDTSCQFEFITDQQFDDNVTNIGPGAGFEGAGVEYCVEALPWEPLLSTETDPTPVTAQLSGLTPSTTYHLRLTAANGGGSTSKDAAGTFKTLDAIPPTLEINPIPPADVGYTTAHVTGTIDRGEPQYTINWDIEIFTEPNPPETGGFICCEQGPDKINEYSKDFKNLKPGTTYYVRFKGADVTGGPVEGYFYSPTEPFTTKGTSAPPIASCDPVPGPIARSAHISCAVDPNAPDGPLPDDGKAAYKTSWKIECQPECMDAAGNGFSGTIDAESGSQPVNGDLARLDPNTDYEVRVIATNGLGTTESTVQTFHTEPIKPTVKAFPGASDGKGGYVLQGSVSPNGSPVTDCTFAWGPEGHEELDEYAFQADCSPMPKGRNEVQSINISNATGGQFKLTYRNQTTADLPFTATAAEVQAALEALTKIGPGSVAVTGHWTVTFQGSLSEVNAARIVVKDGTEPLQHGFLPLEKDTKTISPGGNSSPITVEAPLTGLTPDANYNFRLFATNAAGTEKTENLIFKPTLAKAEPCPENEQLREENNSLALPECRAYEMVTPRGKEGFDATLNTYDGGDRVAYVSSAGNIARSGQGSIKNRYAAARTATGWQTIPNLNGSSGSIYDAPSNVDSIPTTLVAYSSDLRSSLWEMHRKGEFEGSIPLPYHRSPDGTFSPYGPIGYISYVGFTPNIFLVSADLSHIVNTQTPTEWGQGVYEYIGTGMDQPRRVDLDNTGAPISTCIKTPIGNAAPRAVSADGSRIVVVAYGAPSSAPGSCGPGSPPADELWVRIDGTTSIAASASHCDRVAPACNAPADAKFQGATPDGSRVLFTTTQQLVNGDTDQANDLYACDIPAGHPSPGAGNANPCASLRRISGAPNGSADVEAGDVGRPVDKFPVSGDVTVSEDGSTVLFIAKGVLADNEDALAETAVAGDHNLYVWRADSSHPDGQTAFVGRLDSNDLVASFGERPQATPDGRYLVFTTATQLLATDTDNARDAYRYDTDTGELTRVSTNLFGVGGNGEFDVRTGASRQHNPSATVSDDGQKIVFATGEALSPADGNGEPDVYLWTPSRVSLISTGASGSAPRELAFGGVLFPAAAIDPSGENIYFETRGALTPADPDDSTDVYDARIGGGFSFAETPPCVGEDCKPDITPASPNPRSPANTPDGEGNVKPPKPCPKGKVRNKKGKCVPKHKKHQRKSHKKAGHNRGGSK